MRTIGNGGGFPLHLILKNTGRVFTENTLIWLRLCLVVVPEISLQLSVTRKRVKGKYDNTRS